MCNYRLDHASAAPAGIDLLALQQRLNEAISTPGPDSNQWLRDLRLVVLLLQTVGIPNDIPTTTYTAAADKAHAMRGPGTERTRDKSLPPTHTDAMAGLLLAADHLLKTVEGRARLAALYRSASERVIVAWDHAKNLGGASPALHEALHQNRLNTTQPKRLAAYLPPTAELTSAQIPAYLPAALFEAHLADVRQPSGATGQHSRYERPLRRYTPIAMAMHVDQVDATTAGRRLGYTDTLTASACARASQAFRSHGGEPELFRRIAAITNEFATTPRTNYESRRNHFNADWRIPEHEWTDLQAALPRHNRPWDTRRIGYAAWIWSLITSGDPILAPMTRVERNGRHSSNHARIAHDSRRWGEPTLRYLDDLASRLAEIIETQAPGAVLDVNLDALH